MKILLLHSHKTEAATRRIQTLLEPEIEVDVLARRPEDMSKYDAVILHNRLDADPNEPTAIYSCGSLVTRMIEDPKILARVLESKPKAIWTNSYTAQGQLSAIPHGSALLSSLLHIRCMAKPLKLTIPDKCPPFPEEKRILWGWQNPSLYTENIKKPISRLVKMVADDGIKISIVGISSNPEQCSFIKHANVTVAGHINIPKEIHNFMGMVRVTEGLDYGRVTYQILAYGRWCLYVNMHEPHVICADSMDEVPDLVRTLVEQSDVHSLIAEGRREYIAENFSEEALSKKWQEEVMNVFLERRVAV